jgi:hypothetical protein
VIASLKRVGVRIFVDIARVALDHAVELRTQLRKFPEESNVWNRLSGRVAQPHRRNIAGLNVRRPVAFVEKIVEQRVK